MIIAPSAFSLPRPLVGSAIAIGNFDGVHLGHQALVRAALAEAAKPSARVDGRSRDAIALTFDPHPGTVVHRAAAPALLTTLPRRLELLAQLGLTATVIQPFDEAFSQITAEAFATEILARALSAEQVVVGSDFRFGAGRRGDPTMLAELGAQLGFGVTVLDKVQVDGEICSSTAIREHVRAGRVEQAGRLLSRPFEATGVVVRGAQRGRTLGFPTANLDDVRRLVPKEGVYAGTATTLRDGKVHRAAINVGRNPTFVDGGALSVEAFLLDFEGDLYGHELRLGFVARLRDEEKFDSIEALIAQMHHDVAETRRVCA